MEHLFRGDHDEHGAVLAVGRATSNRSDRLLVRRLFLAKDGIDYVPGQRGYRMLRAEFVRDCAFQCSEEGLGYLAVHNHAGRDAVQFSGDDFASHERGYPALLQLIQAPVGALVFAENAVAGDLWMVDGSRHALRSLCVVGSSSKVIYPKPRSNSSRHDGRRQRQTLMLGAEGQQLLRETKVGVIGCGGVGSLIVSALARLGVGHIVLIDPQKIEESNFSRVVGSRESDFWPKLTRSGIPLLQAAGKFLSTKKVDIAKRVVKQANREGVCEAICGDVRMPSVASRLLDCDYLFLSADSMQARLLFNAIVHQYLIPGYQVGAKATANRETGELTSVFSVARRVIPDAGCLWCNGLIPPGRLQEESLSDEQLKSQRYIDDPSIAAPSVVTLNAIGAALAANGFLFAITGLADGEPEFDYLEVDALTGEPRQMKARREASCLECGDLAISRVARGDAHRLPTMVTVS